MPSTGRLSSLSTMVILSICIFISTASSCSTMQFSSVYDPYPECAVPCLACPDPDYTTDFANTCDYDSGACCTSHYHSSIAATWECVHLSCEQDQAQAAFDVFYKFCEDKQKSLAAADIPGGFLFNTSNKDTGDASDNSGGKKLSASEIVGIVVGVAGFFATALGTYYGYRAIRRRRASGGGRTSDTPATANQMQVSHWPERKYDLSNVSLPPGHTVRFSITNSNMNLNGIQRYQETWELRRDANGNTTGGRVQGGRAGQGRILGEV